MQWSDGSPVETYVQFRIVNWSDNTDCLNHYFLLFFFKLLFGVSFVCQLLFYYVKALHNAAQTDPPSAAARSPCTLQFFQNLFVLLTGFANELLKTHPTTGKLQLFSIQKNLAQTCSHV